MIFPQTLRFWKVATWRDFGIESVAEFLPPSEGGWSVTTSSPFSHSNIGLEFDAPRKCLGIELCLKMESFGNVPRKVASRVREFDVKLEYWRLAWPPNRSFGGGWETVDDTVHGFWTRAQSVQHHYLDETSDGVCVQLSFGALSPLEVPGYEGPPLSYRRTLKVRAVLSGADEATVISVRPMLAGTLRTQRLALDWTPRGGAPENVIVDTTNAFIECNDEIAQRAILDAESAAAPLGVHYMESGGADRVGAGHHDAAPGDAPIITFSWIESPTTAGGERTQPASSRISPVGRQVPLDGFSVDLGDLARYGRMWLPDFGVIVRNAELESIPVEDVIREASGGNRRRIDVVESLPDQSFDRARREIPHPDPEAQGRYAVLGTEANRGEFAVRYDGRIFLDKRQLKLRPCDREALPWPAQVLSLDIGLGEQGPSGRSRENCSQALAEGWLPVLTTQWSDAPPVVADNTWPQRSLEVNIECFVTQLSHDLRDHEGKTGLEPSVLLGRLTVTNPSSTRVSRRLWLVLSSDEEYAYHQDVLSAVSETTSVVGISYPRKRYETPQVRLALLSNGDRFAMTQCRSGLRATGLHPALLCELELDPDATFTVDFVLPFEGGWESIEDWDLTYERERRRVIEFWKQRIEPFARIEGIDPHADALIRTAHWHVLVTADKHPATRRWHVGAATWYYWDFPNEACVQARWLDMIGDHTAAEKLLQPAIDGQGVATPPGAYTSTDGCFHHSGAFNMGAYGLDHGWVLCGLADHYFLSHDEQWLRSVADSIVDAAEFVRRERAQTMGRGASNQPGDTTSTESGAGEAEFNGRPIEFGLLPSGAIEDIQEWRYWYETNILCCAGIRSCAEALTEIEDPRAASLRDLADRYQSDITISLTRARIRSVVVRLQDGTWIPHVPSHTDSRVPDSGWIRECLESPIAKAVTIGFWSADDPLVTWLLHDTEENRNREPVTDLGRDPQLWFSQEGFSKQPMLIDLPVAHMLAGRSASAVRGMINAYVALAYEDVGCLAEWVSVLGRGAGPFYKTPDECGWLAWLRQAMVMEHDGSLHVGWGLAESWLRPGRRLVYERLATRYGPVDAIVETIIRGAIVTLHVAEAMVGRSILLKLRLPGASHLVLTRATGVAADAAAPAVGVAPAGASRPAADGPQAIERGAGVDHPIHLTITSTSVRLEISDL